MVAAGWRDLAGGCCVSYASFELAAEAIPHIVWLADASGSTDYFNERGTEYTGLPRQANYGWQWVKLVHPHDAERARFGWEYATRTATPFELSYRIRRSDGEFHWHAFRALPVRGQAGEVVKWIGTADDVDRFRSCRQSVRPPLRAGGGNRLGDTPTLYPGISGPSR